MKVLKYPNKFLKKISEPVTKENLQQAIDLSKEMASCCETRKLLGLAAIQVGVPLRVIVITLNKEPLVMFNPRDVKTVEDMNWFEEGCASLPGLFVQVERPKAVEFVFDNENLEPVPGQFDGKMARVFQHELDHLDGKLFVDRLDMFEREQIQPKLKLIKQFG